MILPEGRRQACRPGKSEPNTGMQKECDDGKRTGKIEQQAILAGRDPGALDLRAGGGRLDLAFRFGCQSAGQQPGRDPLALDRQGDVVCHGHRLPAFHAAAPGDAADPGDAGGAVGQRDAVPVPGPQPAGPDGDHRGGSRRLRQQPGRGAFWRHSRCQPDRPPPGGTDRPGNRGPGHRHRRLPDAAVEWRPV